MAEYDIEFANRLAECSVGIVAEGIDSLDAKRAAIYISLLSTEIALKALLEKAGKPICEIRNRSHKLKELLRDIGDCEIRLEVIKDDFRWISASDLRSQTVDDRFGNAVVGVLVDAEDGGASVYPNQIRYGDVLRHYPAEVIPS